MVLGTIPQHFDITTEFATCSVIIDVYSSKNIILHFRNESSTTLSSSRRLHTSLMMTATTNSASRLGSKSFQKNRYFLLFCRRPLPGLVFCSQRPTYQSTNLVITCCSGHCIESLFKQDFLYLHHPRHLSQPNVDYR